MADDFKGFPKDFFAFFKELKANNNRVWFEDNKPRFRDNVQAPMSAFISAMAPRVAKISKNFNCDPRPNGGSMFRIYRDVRFSKDKSPYKLHAACHFRHRGGKDVHAPGFYMHFSPSETVFGGGSWMPDPDALASVRQAIAQKPAAWKKVLDDKAFRKHFDHVEGEALSRPPRGFEADSPFIDDIKKKSYYAMREEGAKLAQSPKLLDEITDTFKSVSPLMKYLCGTLGVPY